MMFYDSNRIGSIMAAQGLDGLIATTFENVYYLTGIASTTLRLFPRDGQAYSILSHKCLTAPILVVSTGDLDQTVVAPELQSINYGVFVREISRSAELTDVEKHLKKVSIDRAPEKTPLAALIKALSQAGLDKGVVGIDEAGIAGSIMNELRLSAPQLELRPARSLFRTIRSIKNNTEIEMIRQSTRITEKATMAAVAIAREGVTENEMARAFEQEIARNGAQPLFTQIRFGRNGAISQVEPGSTRLKKGELIWFDVGCDYRGFKSDIARNFILGEPERRVSDLFAAVVAGEDEAFRLLKPGITAGKVFEATVDRVRNAGIPNYRRHHVGHGIGIETYEPPLFAPDQDLKIAPGMVVNIETPYYEVGFGAIHIEDTVVIRDDGPELLTTLPRELVSV